MALEYRNRTELVSNQAGGLQGFIDRATEATAYALTLETKISVREREAADLQKLLDKEREGTGILQEKVAALEAERSELSKGRKKFKELAATAQDKLKASEEKIEGQALEFAAERKAWEDRKAELQESLLESFEWGFDKCVGQITRKFPEHNLDLSQLDVAEPDPTLPTHGTAEAQVETPAPTDAAE